jgi:hypothetical protein
MFGFVSDLKVKTICKEALWWTFKPKQFLIWVCEWFES